MNTESKIRILQATLGEMSPVVFIILPTLTEYCSDIPMHIIALIPRPLREGPLSQLLARLVYDLDI